MSACCVSALIRWGCAGHTAFKLGAVVGADALGGAVRLDGLGEHDHDVVGTDATGDVVGDALLRMLVDEHEGAEAGIKPFLVQRGSFQGATKRQ